MKKLFFSVAAVCLLSTASFASNGKNKATKHAVKKEARASKKAVCCPDCPPNCTDGCCNR